MKFFIACPGKLRAEPIISCSVWGRREENMQNPHSFTLLKKKKNHMEIFLCKAKEKRKTSIRGGKFTTKENKQDTNKKLFQRILASPEHINRGICLTF